MSESQLNSAHGYQGSPTVRINDIENTKLSDLVRAFRMTEREGGLSSLELRLGNFDATKGPSTAVYALEDERDLKLGSRITLYAGDSVAPSEIFRGIVTGLEVEFPQAGTSEILVLAEDPLQLARQARRSKVHSDLVLSQLANDVAAQLGLTPKVTELNDSIGTHVQLNESDLAFLRRLLTRYDADLQVVGKELHVSPRKDVQRGTLELQFGSQLLGVRFHVDLADQVTEITTSGWDPTQGKRVAGSSQGANLGPGNGRSGASLLGTALAARSEHISHPSVMTDDEASALADAVFDRRARRFVCVHGTVQGNPRIRVGTHLTLTGTSERFNNTYYVVSACHHFTRGDYYETDFEAECAYLGNPS